MPNLELCLPGLDFFTYQLSLMIRILIALVTILIVVRVQGQQNDLRVVSSAGASFYNDELILDWTMGEVLVETMERPSMMISQGFQQPVYSLVSTRPTAEEDEHIIVFPNPFSDQLTIQSPSFSRKKGVLKIADITGTILWEQTIDGSRNEEHYSGAALSPGCYILTIQYSGFPGCYTIPVLKLN